VSQGKGNRRVSFDDTSVPRGQQVQIVQGGSKQGNLNANARKDPRDQKNRPASAFQKKSRLVKDEEAERIKNE
jgi:hypothetical protein